MDKVIRILHLEDDAADAELIQATIEAAGIACVITLVQTREEFSESLLTGGYDIILADYKLPMFDGISALQITLKNDLQIPFIFVSGTMGEDIAIECLTEGATDYVLKQKLSRLVPAIMRALQETENQRERKQAEEALRHSEKEKTILNQIANVFLTIPDEEMYGCVLSIVLSVVQSKYGIFGYIGEQGDLIIPSMTKEIWEECQVKGKTIIYPADSWGESLWGRAIRENRSFSSNGPFCTPEGHICINHFLTAPIVFGEETIGLISVANKEGGFNDEDREMLERITVYISPILNARLQRDRQERSRVEAEAALRESEEKYRLLVANAGEAIFIAQDEVVKFPNPRSLEMTGYTADELSSIPFHELIHPADRDIVFKKYLDRMEGEKPPESYRFRIKKKSGDEMWAQLTAAPINWEGRPGTLCFLRDVTEEKKLEAQLMQAQKMEALGTLASGIAHDFNNILTPIIGFTDMSISMYGDQKGLAENLGEIMSASYRAKDLVKQILTYTRQIETEPQPVQLKYLVKETLKLLKATIPKTIEITLNNLSNAKVMVDPTHIHQIIMNLCTNAIHAMKEKGGILSVRLEDFDADDAFASFHPGSSPGKYILFSVKDTGHGMTQEIMDKIFEPYFTTKEVGTGTGLGLAVVTGIIQKYNGAIAVESSPGKGSTFKVFLPVLEQESPYAVTSKEGLPTGNESILFIDDEHTIVKYGKMMLEQLGYSVTTATSSRNAIDIFQKHNDQFDLVITDMIMPDIPGDELVMEMIKIRRDIPIILCSGNVDIVPKEVKEKMGIKGYVSKPIIKGDLAGMVRKVLDNVV